MMRAIRRLNARTAITTASGDHPIDGTCARGLLRRSVGMVATLVLLFSALVVGASEAAAQDLDRIVQDLEAQGWYIESGADGTTTDFGDLARRAAGRGEQWYFVSLAGPVDPDYADLLRDEVRPTGNVIVYFVDADDFLNVQMASGSSESIEDQALAPFDDDWDRPDEFMLDVVSQYERLTAATSSGATTTGSAGSDSGAGAGSGAGASWLWIAVPVGLVGGGLWFSGRRKKSKADADELETAQKIRAEIQSELDELANDVIVLNSAVDLSSDDVAIAHYREATATYTDISDEIPDLDELESANLQELSELGARVAHARWQMDAAEAMIGGEPVPEKPKVEPPPAPARPSSTEPARVPPQIQQRQARPRTQYSRSRRSSGGGLLDILIAGASMMGNSRSRGRSRSRNQGGMFGGGSPTRRTPRTSQRRTTRRSRSGGGVFGGSSSGSRRSSGRRSTSRTRSRSSSRARSSSTRSRASSSRRSSSRRRRR